MNFCIYLVIFFVSIFCTSAFEFCDQSRLRNEIFNERKVDNITRPVQNINDTIDLKIYLFIYHIFDLDEQTETFSFDGWLMHQWLDKNLAWNQEDFENCHGIYVYPEQIWRPTVYLLNRADASNTVQSTDLMTAFVTFTGQIFWFTVENYKSICPLDFSAYPFDEHLCQMTFISWSHSGNELNMSLAYFDSDVPLHIHMNDEHNTWEVVETFSNVTVWYYGEDFFYQEVNFFVRLKRHSPIYHLALVTPNAISILVVLLIFWLPHESNNKLLISGINLIILTILIIQCQWVVPRSGSNVPAIIILCGNSIFFAGIAFVICVSTTCIYKDPPSIYPPTWIKNVLTGWLGVVLCIDFQKTDASINPQLLTKEISPHATTWRLIAVAIDRFCFILYCIIITFILIFTFA